MGEITHLLKIKEPFKRRYTQVNTHNKNGVYELRGPRIHLSRNKVLQSFCFANCSLQINHFLQILQLHGLKNVDGKRHPGVVFLPPMKTDLSPNTAGENVWESYKCAGSDTIRIIGGQKLEKLQTDRSLRKSDIHDLQMFIKKTRASLKLTWQLYATSTMNEDVFPIEHRDLPVSC